MDSASVHTTWQTGQPCASEYSFQGHGGVPVSVTFSMAVIKPHDQGGLEEEWFIWANVPERGRSP